MSEKSASPTPTIMILKGSSLASEDRYQELLKTSERLQNVHLRDTYLFTSPKTECQTNQHRVVTFEEESLQ